MAIRAIILLISGILSVLASIGIAEAGALRIAPILVDVRKGATSTIELNNLEDKTANVQIRIFRWVQQDGENKLLPTRDVVASPPFAKIAPGGRNKIRIVRLSKEPLTGEEAYRLLIDQIPDRSRSSTLKVGIALRYSVPVFFGTQDTAKHDLKWSVKQSGGKTYVTAVNYGNTRAKLTALSLMSSTGKSLSFGNRLVGYVLGNSRATWAVNGRIASAANERITITAQTENGEIRSETNLQTAK